MAAVQREHTARERRPSVAAPGSPTRPPVTAPLGFVLVCNVEACAHVWEPNFDEVASGRTACPKCDGWTFLARLSEPGDD